MTRRYLSPHCHAPSLQSNSDDDDDVSGHGMPSPQAIRASSTLHSPAYVAKPHPPDIPQMYSLDAGNIPGVPQGVFYDL